MISEVLMVKLLGDAAGFNSAMTSAAAVAAATATTITRVMESGARAAFRLGVEYENQITTFRVLTGDLQRGLDLYKKVEDLAIATPYRTSALAVNVQQLLGMGVSESNTIPVLGRLGDVAAGSEDKLRRLSLVYGQVVSLGRFQGQDAMQFAQIGIGYKDFAQTVGKSVAELRGDMEAGLVGADVVTKTINRLTSEGGRFSGLSREVNRTVGGQLNALTETAEKFGRRFGEAFFIRFNVAENLGGVTSFLENVMSPDAAGISGVDKVVDLLQKGKDLAVDFYAVMMAGWRATATVSEPFMRTLEDMNATWTDSRDVILATVGGAGLMFFVFVDAARIQAMVLANILEYALVWPFTQFTKVIAAALNQLANFMDAIASTASVKIAGVELIPIAGSAAEAALSIRKMSTDIGDAGRKADEMAVKLSAAFKVEKLGGVEFMKQLTSVQFAKDARRNVFTTADQYNDNPRFNPQNLSVGEALQYERELGRMRQIVTQSGGMQSGGNRTGPGGMSLFPLATMPGTVGPQQQIEYYNKTAGRFYDVDKFNGTVRALGDAVGALVPKIELTVTTDPKVAAMAVDLKKSLLEGITPYEKYARQLDYLNKAVNPDPKNADGAALNNAEFRVGLVQNYERRLKLNSAPSNKAPSVLRDSQEAQNAINTAMDRSSTVEEEVLRNVRIQTEIQSRTEVYQKRVADVLEQLNKEGKLPTVMRKGI